MRNFLSTARLATRSCVVAAALSIALTGAAAAQSLKQTLATAYLESGLLDQERALLRAADEGVAQALSALRPVIGYSAATRRQTQSGIGGSDTSITTTIGISASLLVYDFGRSATAVEAAKASVLATRHTLTSAEQDVLLRAAAAFMKVRAERSSVALQRNNIQLLREELRAANDRFDVGEITRTDVAFAEARLSSSQASLAAAQATLQSAEAEYLAAVGKSPNELSAPPSIPRPASSLQEAKRIALQRHPDILAAQQNVTAAELNIRRAELATRPSVSIQGSVQAQGGGDATEFGEQSSMGVEVTGPIYQGGQLSSLKRQAAAQRDAARSALHLARVGVEQNVANAWANLKAAESSLAASQEQVRASRTAFEGIREEALLGSRTTLDVLDAEQELLNARSNVIAVEASRQVAAYQLLAAMGLMTAERLGLDVPLYDPAQYYDLARSAPSPVSERGKQLDDLMERLGRD